jgi:CBS domain-containing protein
MKRDPITVTPKTPTLEALGIMRRSKVGCLPVVENGKLIGIVTAYDFLALSAEIIEKQLKAPAPAEEPISQN